jgi:hypothetical protein
MLQRDISFNFFHVPAVSLDILKGVAVNTRQPASPVSART